MDWSLFWTLMFQTMLATLPIYVVAYVISLGWFSGKEAGLKPTTPKTPQPADRVIRK